MLLRKDRSEYTPKRGVFLQGARFERDVRPVDDWMGAAGFSRTQALWKRTEKVFLSRFTDPNIAVVRWGVGERRASSYS